MTTALRPAAAAFDAIASVFDEKFGAFLSVAAQRRAVRSALLRAFPSGGRILELGGGTGEDAGFLAERGYHVLLTDPSPEMVRIAQTKLAQLGSKAKVASGEELHLFAEEYLSQGEAEFDGVFSNFAPLNCVADLGSVAHALARLMKPGAPAMLVLFGTLCPGEMVTEIVRGRPHLALRRLMRGEAPARLAKRDFHVVYHRRKAIVRAFAPWFTLERRIGIGVAVPPKRSRAMDIASSTIAEGDGEDGPRVSEPTRNAGRSRALSISSHRRTRNRTMIAPRQSGDMQTKWLRLGFTCTQSYALDRQNPDFFACRC